MKTNTEIIADFIGEHAAWPPNPIAVSLETENLSIRAEYLVIDDRGEPKNAFARFYQRMGCWFYSIGADNARYNGQVPSWDGKTEEALNALQMELLETATA